MGLFLLVFQGLAIISEVGAMTLFSYARRGAAVLLFGVLLVGCAEQEPYKIGFVAGLSGRVADLGIGGRNGVMLAIEERNRAGGINGRQILLEVRDDQQDPETAKKVVNELIDSGVNAIIGHMTSSMSVTTVPIVNQRQVLMVSPTTTTRQLTGIDDYFFRVISDTSVYGRRNAEYRFQSLGHRRVAAIYDQRNAAYTESWLQSFKDAFEKQGGKVILELGYRSDDNVHFNALAQQLLDAEPDSIQIVASAMDAALLVQQLRKFAPELPIATSEWAATEKLTELGGAAVEGVLMAQFFDRGRRTPHYQAVHKAFVDRYSQPPGFAEIAGYDAAQLVLTALAEQRKGESLKDTIGRIRSFQAAQGVIQVDQYGDAGRETYLTEVRDGRFVAVE